MEKKDLTEEDLEKLIKWALSFFQPTDEHNSDDKKEMKS